MKPQHQTIFAPPLGNCMQACIATLMDRDIDTVPNFMEWYAEDDTEWWPRYMNWVAEQGYFVCEFPGRCIEDAPYSMGMPVDAAIMVTVKSPRGDWAHCVIANARLTKVLWDPYPDGESVDLNTAQWIGVIVKVVP